MWCKPIDVIAFLVILLGFISMLFGVDGKVQEMVFYVLFFYFGVKTNLPSDKLE